ncbi:MAG: hypothetical protein KY447_07225 [Actinobacteria bacterium]|nr:hypothetical protein [Actinomycetota bacterium]
MPNYRRALLGADTDLAILRPAAVAQRRARSARLPDDTLAAWLVEIVAGGSKSYEQSELADWIMAAVPRRHWTAVGHLWCTMSGLTTNRAGVIRLSGPLTLEQARHVLWAVRRRARGDVRDELAAQSARRRREVPVGDLHGGAVA